MLQLLRDDVKNASDPEKGKFFSRFFKTGEGEYGYGDVFYGLTVPQSRKIATKYKALSLNDVTTLLQSKVHEERLIALLILVHKFQKTNPRKEIFDFYLAHTQYINNWDLVDLSADQIVGEYLWESPQPPLRKGGVPQDGGFEILFKFAHSKNLWERRIAMIATFAFIKHGESDMTFAIADILLQDQHDLIQKAVGWMLREVGKRVLEEVEEEFLKTRYKTMPRTALRYAIERFSEEKRTHYLRR